MIFLAVFYFVIATNTQTGWLFILSAFLLGLLAISWMLSRNSCQGVEVDHQWIGEPQKNQPFRIRITTRNSAKVTKNEILLSCPSPNWSNDELFQWAIPKLRPGGVAETVYRMTPRRRGEHTLGKLILVCGAPFGLFTQTRTFENPQTFLVYPEIAKLPAQKTRSLLSTAVSDFVSPSGLGDSHSLRAVRDYRPGDDLRHIHWKASAKRGSSANLLVREHHAPAPTRSTVVLDTSQSEEECFDKAVSLAASILWSANRQGVRVMLVMLEESGGLSLWKNWPEQYRALAKVQQNPKLSFQEWAGQVEKMLTNTSKYALATAGGKEAQISNWPSMFDSVFLVGNQEDLKRAPAHRSCILIAPDQEGFQEMSSGRADV